MAYIIFDLDHTVSDSTHRQLTKPDGSLDLAHWLENCTEAKIMADTLLPLADTMRRMYETGNTVVVCTARSGDCLHDKAFLAKHNLPYHHWLSRGDSQEGDGALKVRLLNEFAISQGFDCIGDMRPIMFDDNLAVIRALTSERVRMINAIDENKRLQYNRARRAA